MADNRGCEGEEPLGAEGVLALIARALDKDDQKAVDEDEARRCHAAATAGQRHRAVRDRDGAVHGLGDRPLGSLNRPEFDFVVKET